MLHLAATSSAAQQPLEVLRTDIPKNLGMFGQACSISGGRIAIGSDERESFAPIFDDGSVVIFERGATGGYEIVQRIPSQCPPHCINDFGGIVILRGSSLVVGGAGAPRFFEYQLSPSGWGLHETIALAPGYNGITSIAYDGNTLFTGSTAAAAVGSPQQNDSAVVFWERNGTWTPVVEFRASQLGLPTSGNFGWRVFVDGDVATASTSGTTAPGLMNVGAASVFRRIQGVWTHEATLHHPYPGGNSLSFGARSLVAGEWLFIGCETDLLVPGFDRAGAVYIYRNVPGSGWTLHTRLQPTVGPQEIATNTAFGTNLAYANGRLVVGAGAHRLAFQGPTGPTGGLGTIYSYELCGDIWSQSVAATAPYYFGGAEFGAHLALEGDVLVAGGMRFSGYWTPQHPFAFSRAGIAAVAILPPTTTPHCNEVGRVLCTPAALETTDCPCVAASPGLGCPNAVGPGARLYLEGTFNQVEIRRAIVDGLPPGATTTLVLGRPTPILPAGNHFGGGVVCIPAPIGWRVGIADATGAAVFDHVLAPDPLVLRHFGGLQLPFQALYHSALPDTCGNTSNASNAVLLTLYRLL
ncbi:MAG: hypothetical protein H0V54_06635 [Chthoniobacterales bacterium]|nr:hypothetical protein [Chthoniobacterales bacterium]